MYAVVHQLVTSRGGSHRPRSDEVSSGGSGGDSEHVIDMDSSDGLSDLSESKRSLSPSHSSNSLSTLAQSGGGGSLGGSLGGSSHHLSIPGAAGGNGKRRNSISPPSLPRVTSGPAGFNVSGVSNGEREQYWETCGTPLDRSTFRCC